MSYFFSSILQFNFTVHGLRHVDKRPPQSGRMRLSIADILRTSGIFLMRTSDVFVAQNKRFYITLDWSYNGFL